MTRRPLPSALCKRPGGTLHGFRQERALARALGNSSRESNTDYCPAGHPQTKVSSWTAKALFLQSLFPTSGDKARAKGGCWLHLRHGLCPAIGSAQPRLRPCHSSVLPLSMPTTGSALTMGSTPNCHWFHPITESASLLAPPPLHSIFHSQH